jgi:hypothetical protein
MKMTDEVRDGIRRMMAHTTWSTAHSGILAERPEWSVYTNGAALVAVRGKAFPDDGDFGRYAKATAAHMDKVTAARLVGPTSREQLLEFCGPSRPLPEPCDTCETSGYVECDECDGEGGQDCTCDCGDEHERECDACNNEGSVECPMGCEDPKPPVAPGKVDGILVDRTRLREVVEACPFEDEEKAELVLVDGGVGLRGRGWMALLMALADRGEEANKTCPEWRAHSVVT